MLKKNVKSELGDKIEIHVLCDLTQRQKKLNQVLKSQMSSNYDDIENAAGSEENNSDQNLINAVILFRKVCNHPVYLKELMLNHRSHLHHLEK